MKTKIILLALAIMSSSLVFSQTVQHESKTDCEQKVLKKIKSKMNYLNVKDYLVEGQKNTVIVTCYVNEDNQIEVAKINGYDKELNQAVIETLERHPVNCEKADSGEYFTFKMTFYHHPA